jgi:hypothetical protein
LRVTGNQVRLGIDAPDQDCILRVELARWQEGPAACNETADPACPCGDEVRPKRALLSSTRRSGGRSRCRGR